ncbi:winged helix-turn-helix domain-containing protein [Rhodohalobacter barkolensis]|uniref:Transcriptional regulator n=1 Tax=Rhodohalobacter barkolensis TaxID=2053187 RepID=A0A2N0VI96_9BACT|nr:transcriptional regulator [Rhodohalobacter barkolensis]PKD43858.1 transcriptional regulator [Rhodohalobacter barkolensis]
MNISFDDLHKAFESRIRLGIMSVLAVNESLDFTALKEFLDVTDGNLATHLKKLEKEEFISVEKSFIDNKPNTKYSMTPNGKEAFDNHLQALEAIIKSQKES